MRALPSSRRSGFTLIELIFVLALLAIGALFVMTSMGSFFRGRALNFEARRLLSLTHYAQSRAVAEGVPVVLWINPADSTYGLTIQSSFSDPEGDTRAVRYTVDSSLKLEAPQVAGDAASEQDDEKLGITIEGVTFIRFTPDGFYDDSSVPKITIRQGTEAALELVPTLNRLDYESALRPMPTDATRSLSLGDLPRGHRHRRNGGAFTLAEVLAALLFMAILVPVAMQGVSVASRAGTLGQRKAIAMRIAERVLDEQIISGQLATAVPYGNIVEGDISYPWTLKSDPWPEDTTISLNVVTVRVEFVVQGNTYDVAASTLYDPLAVSTVTTSTPAATNQ